MWNFVRSVKFFYKDSLYSKRSLLWGCVENDFIRAIEHFFRVYISSSRHPRGWENSRKIYKSILDDGAPALICLGLSKKYWSSPDLNSMRWLGLFRNKTFRKHLKLIFPQWDFIIYIVSLEISVSSLFCHPLFSIRILSSAFFYPPSAIRRHPVHTLQRPKPE